MRFETLLIKFCKFMDLDANDCQKDNRYEFTFDDHLTVNCIPDGENRLIMYGTAGRVPESARETADVLKNLLQINLVRMKHQKEILSIDLDVGEIVLYNRVTINDLTVEEFEEIMEHFINNLEFWCDSAGERPPSAQPFPMMFP